MILEGGNIYNHSGLSRNWLHQDMLPGNVQMRRQVVYNATGYHYQEGCQFILVDHGGGCLIVNGDAYSLEAGSCCLLFVHHFYSIKPSLPHFPSRELVPTEKAFPSCWNG